MKPAHQALALLALGIAFGVAIWRLSPWLLGTVEPWDAEAPIWTFSWLVVAILGGLVGRVRGIALPIGYALGQVLVTLRSPFPGEFALLGWLFIGTHAAGAVVITLLVAGIVALARRARGSRPRGPGR